MNLLRKLISNHVLANMTFVLVIVFGFEAYLQMPRSKGPEINLNWVTIFTVLPGASPTDVERRITDPLEDAIRNNVNDIRFVISTSRESVSSILMRFNELDEKEFDKRVAILRREVQNAYLDELPDEAEDPLVQEINMSNAYPTALIAVTSPGDDENLSQQVLNITKALERLEGSEQIVVIGRPAPELHIAFFPERLEGLGITPADISRTVRAYFRDISIGDLETADGKWVVRLHSTDADPSVLRDIPVITATGEFVPLGSLAELTRAGRELQTRVAFRGEPAVMLAVTKRSGANLLELVDRIKEYIEERNRFRHATGVELFLVDDQTGETRNSLELMQNNTLVGFLLVLLTSWVFLGARIAFFTSIGIFFTLAGAFLVLSALEFSLSNTVLLGIIIALGMIVDDAVVVVEAIYYRLRQGFAGINCVVDAIDEVGAPVATSVLTTIAAFLPLMLLTGVLGDLMRVVPLVVIVALLASLAQAYWILPTHVLSVKTDFSRPGLVQRNREKLTRWIRYSYLKALVRALRYPLISIAGIMLIFILALGALRGGYIRANFFEADLQRLFYLNIEMPQGTSLEDTSQALSKIEKAALEVFLPGQMNASLAVAGQQFTRMEPLYGDTIGQVLFSLKPQVYGERPVTAITNAVRTRVKDIPGPVSITVEEISNSPPPGKPVSAKILGNDYEALLAASAELQAFLEARPEYRDVTTDYRPGNPELVLRLNGEAIQRAGLDPAVVTRVLQTYVDGETVTDFHDRGEEVKVRVLAKTDKKRGIDNFLAQTISLGNGQSIPISELVHGTIESGQQNIRHYNFLRAITLDSELNTDITNTVQANELIRTAWADIQGRYPALSLDLTGELDDIQESLESLGLLTLLGLSLIYIILGTQFRSYFQPFLVIAAVPMAFTGVILGLLVTQHAVSLFTMYGIVALFGISVNAAIVLICAANSRLESGMDLLHATVYAAKRRVIPVIITSITTIAGLFSLAAGLAGKSVIWSNVATAIVWGLAFSTILSLFLIPLMYRVFMAYGHRTPARAASSP